MTTRIDDLLAQVIALEKQLEDVDIRRSTVDADDFATRLNLKTERQQLELRLAEVRRQARDQD